MGALYESPFPTFMLIEVGYAPNARLSRMRSWPDDQRDLAALRAEKQVSERTIHLDRHVRLGAFRRHGKRIGAVPFLDNPAAKLQKLPLVVPGSDMVDRAKDSQQHENGEKECQPSRSSVLYR